MPAGGPTSGTEIKHTFCRLCEVMCGLTVTVTDGTIDKVRPDREHPVSQGFACNKGLIAGDIHRDPDRLDHPMRRTGATWEQISWTDAATEVAARLQDIIQRHGPESVAVYLGNPNAFNPLAGPAAAMFLLSMGSGQVFSSATQDCANKFTVSEILYGSADIHPAADIEATDHLLLLGSNPRISKSSFISVPDPVAAMRRVVERGGKVTFVNPLRIESDLGETIQLRPDTDPYLLAGMLHHIDRTVGFDLSSYGGRVHNLEPLREWLADLSPNRVAPVVGLDPTVIERLAEEFSSAPSAAVHASTGVNMGRQGALAYYLVQMLALVTGNFDRRGGNVERSRAIEPMGATAGLDAASFEPTPFGRVRRSKGCLPGALLPAWIRHPDTPIRALISVAGNPVLTMAGGDELTGALAGLDLLVSVDLYRNATADLAHYALPATDWFERPDLNVFTQGVQSIPHIQYTDAVVPPTAERKHETEIFVLLSEAMAMEPLVGSGTEALAAAYDGDLAVHGLSVAELATRVRGLAILQEDEPGAFFDHQVRTPDGRVDAAPDLLVDAMTRGTLIFEQLLDEPMDRLQLITRRTRNTLNSAMANIGKLKSRGAAANPLWIHPADAAARGLRENDPVEISNDHGTVVAPVAFDENLRPGVVSMTHGFGFADNPGMPVAQQHPGVNVNILTPYGPDTFDPLSGMTQLTGIPVAVTALTGSSL